ncbi:MAG TPA: hypothetical protein PKB10_08340, partial [Tepidisphaeraceae bacterium]|nr:hypothetical protein [Tepidisphaeraceae bacterium]
PPIGLAVMRAVPQLKMQRFTTLLDFENEMDAVFVVAPGGGAVLDDAVSHTGSRSLRTATSVSQLQIKLGALMRGRAFPGGWLLAGAQLRSPVGGAVEIELRLADTVLSRASVNLTPGEWTAGMVDLTGVSESAPAGGDPGKLLLVLKRQAGVPMWVDDVLLVDNAQTLLDGSVPDALTPMSVRKRGLKVSAEVPGRFAVSLDAVEGSVDGWFVDEVSPLRARFVSDARGSEIVVYANGVGLWDGQLRLLAAGGASEADRKRSHAAPLTVEIDESLGRLRRTTAGDENNDGYNERLGAYQIEAAGRRIEMVLRPTTPVVLP